MLAKTLESLIHQNLTSAREVGELTGVAPSTVYRWINGESEPSFNTIRLLIRHLPSREAQRILLGAITAGTSWQWYNVQSELDVNADGRVDLDDALDSAIRSVKAAGDMLTNVREACKDGVVTEQESVQVMTSLTHVVRQCTITQQVVIRLAEGQRRRKAL